MSATHNGTAYRNRLARHRQVTERRIARFIAKHLERFGAAPSQREIAAAIGMSQPAAFRHMAHMIDQGLIERVPTMHRGLRLTASGMRLAKKSAAQVAA